MTAATAVKMPIADILHEMWHVAKTEVIAPAAEGAVNIVRGFFTSNAQTNIEPDAHELAAAYGPEGAAHYAALKRSADLHANFLKTLRKGADKLAGLMRPKKPARHTTTPEAHNDR